MATLDRDPLEWFRTGARCYRFRAHRFWWFRLLVGGTLLVATGIAIAWVEMTTLGRLIGVSIVLACLVLAARFAPGLRWFEVEDAGAVWRIRQRFGWSLSTREIEKAQVAMATVEAEPRQTRFEDVYHHVAIFLVNDLPFARAAPPPIVLGDAFGLPVAVLLELCILLAPGYARETYLLNHEPRPRRRARTRARDRS